MYASLRSIALAVLAVLLARCDAPPPAGAPPPPPLAAPAVALDTASPIAIHDVRPDSGPVGGGTVVTIDGAGFIGPIDVTIGGRPATAPTVDAAGTRVTALTAAAPVPGAGDVIVRSFVNGPA